MVELARIEARLESVGQLGELVGALRSIAASRVREAQEALAGTKAFCDTVDRAIASINPADSPPRQEKGKAVLLAITSENGFVGGFNTRIMDRLQDARETDAALLLVGRRGQILAMERDLDIDIAMPMTSRAKGVTPLARQIAAKLAGVTRAGIIYAQHQKSGTFAVAYRQVLPLAPKAMPDIAAQQPLYHLPAARLLAQLASEYLFAEIAQALMQSIVSENNARLMTMDAASRNIDERLEKLHRQERMARQDQTTADMLDVIVGSEAVNHG